MGLPQEIVLADRSGVYFSVHREPLSSGERVREQAEELVDYLGRALGRPIPEHDPNRPIVLALKLDPLTELQREEFLIDASPRRVELVARTSAGMWHAVSWFLEHTVGVRWLWPGAGGECVPALDRFVCPLGTQSHQPDYHWRGLQVRGAIYGQAGGIDLLTMRRVVLGLPVEYQQEFDRWCRRQRLGGDHIADGHRWCEIAPPQVYGPTEPEIYALIDSERDCQPHDGKHGNQPCLTNSRVADLMVDYACAQFESDPMLDAVSIAINDNDGRGMCQCDVCREYIEQLHEQSHLDQLTNEFSSTGRTVGLFASANLVYQNANEVAERVRMRCPGKKVLILLYDAAREPPKGRPLAPDVIGQLCVMGSSLWNPQILNAERKTLDALREAVPTLGIYEYYANGAWPEIHRLFPQLIGESVNLYYDAGARYFATQPSMGFACNGLNYYVLARLLWDRQQPVVQIVDDYCRHGFGPAAPMVKDYFQAFADRWKQTQSGTTLSPTPEPRLALAELYDAAFIRSRHEQLDEAQRTAGTDGRIAQRISFLRRGLQYTELYCTAVRQTAAVYEALGCESQALESHCQQSSSDSFNQAQAAAARQAVAAWDVYWQFVKSHQGQYVFGEYWANYRPGVMGREDQTLQRLREITNETHSKCRAGSVAPGK